MSYSDNSADEHSGKKRKSVGIKLETSSDDDIDIELEDNNVTAADAGGRNGGSSNSGGGSSRSKDTVVASSSSTSANIKNDKRDDKRHKGKDGGNITTLIDITDVSSGGGTGEANQISYGKRLRTKSVISGQGSSTVIPGEAGGSDKNGIGKLIDKRILKSALNFSLSDDRDDDAKIAAKYERLMNKKELKRRSSVSSASSVCGKKDSASASRAAPEDSEGSEGSDDSDDSDEGDERVTMTGFTSLCCGGRCVWARDATFSSTALLAFTLLQFCLLLFICMLQRTSLAEISSGTASSPESLYPTNSTVDSLVKGGTGQGLLFICIDAFLLLVVTALMYCTIVTNPGILEKEEAGSFPVKTTHITPEGSSSGGGQKPPLAPNDAKPSSKAAKETCVTIKGNRVRLSYCETCNIMRPPRAGHCGECQNCVEGFDHHCGVIGACIGRGNMRHFICFLFSFFLRNVCHVIFCLKIYFATKEDLSKNYVDRLTINSIAAFLVAIAVIFSLTSGYKCARHSLYITKGYTMREWKRSDVIYSNPHNNPFDEGCCGNCKYFFCGSNEE